MPFCPQCGSDNPASARFCDQCGAVLIPVPAAPGATIPAPVVPQAAPAAAPAPGAASAGPSVCPQCGTAVIPGEAFCDNCGAALLGPARPAAGAPAPGLPYGGVPPQPSYPAPQPVTSAPQPSYPAPQPATPAPQPAVRPPVVTPPAPARTTLAPARLVAQPGGAVIALPVAASALLGRADAVSNFFPDVDFTPHGALEHGVGRRHARLFVQDGQVLVEDLDSTNGTSLNAARLRPGQPAPVKAGDLLRLGNLTLRVEL